MPQHPDTVNLQTAAKMVGYGPNRLFKLLRDKKVLNNHNIPYQTYIDRGYFHVYYGTWRQYRIGKDIPYAKTLVTPKGIEWLAKLIQEEQAA